MDFNFRYSWRLVINDQFYLIGHHRRELMFQHFILTAVFRDDIFPLSVFLHLKLIIGQCAFASWINDYATDTAFSRKCYFNPVRQCALLRLPKFYSSIITSRAFAESVNQVAGLTSSPQKEEALHLPPRTSSARPPLSNISFLNASIF